MFCLWGANGVFGSDHQHHPEITDEMHRALNDFFLRRSPLKSRRLIVLAQTYSIEQQFNLIWNIRQRTRQPVPINHVRSDRSIITGHQISSTLGGILRGIDEQDRLTDL